MSASPSSWSVPDSPSQPTSPEAEAEPPPNSPSPPSSSLGWYYIIQTLADSKADLPLLKELINRLPNFYTHAPQSVLDRVALRYLEVWKERRGRGIVDTKDNTDGATAIDISQPTLHNFKRPKERIPETSIPIEPSRNENDNNLRFNADFRDDASDCERFMGSPIPFSEQNQCIVCNKGGQLLTCSRKGCGITVHESCIMTTPISFDKEGRFYCPYCVCSIARESLSFLEMKKDENQEKGEKGKQKGEKNITGKRKGKKAVFSDDDTAEDENGDATLLSVESDLRDSRRKVDKNGKRKEKQVKSNDRNVSKDRDILGGRGEEAKKCEADSAFALLDKYVSKDRDILGGRGEEAKKCEADSAFALLDKYIRVKSGPGATSGNHEAVPINEETGNERRRDDRINADAKSRKKRRSTHRYSNKVAGPQRRKMLPWSAEEENALREGMKKFGVTGTVDGRIPWSAILELYPNVFHKTRIPSDLKDKWRNIMKKEERVDS